MDEDEVSLTGAAQILQVTKRRAQQITVEHPELALTRDSNGRRRLSAARVSALALARAARAASKPDDATRAAVQRRMDRADAARAAQKAAAAPVAIGELLAVPE